MRVTIRVQIRNSRLLSSSYSSKLESSPAGKLLDSKYRSLARSAWFSKSRHTPSFRKRPNSLNHALYASGSWNMKTTE